MGSWVYASRCRQRRERIYGMLSLETIGYYSDAPGSQRYPIPFALFYPDTANFIGIVGNLDSKNLVNWVTETFRRYSDFPSESLCPRNKDGLWRNSINFISIMPDPSNL